MKEILVAVLAGIVLSRLKFMAKIHPVKGLERLIDRVTAYFRRRLCFEMRNAGVAIALCVTLSVMLGVFLLSLTGWGTRAVLMALLFSARPLTNEALRVLRALRRHELTAARGALIPMVYRDTDRMTEADVIRALTECLSRSIVPLMVAPVFWAMIGSLIGQSAVFMAGYVTLRELDRRIGRDRDGCEDIGIASSGLCRAAEWLPTRLGEVEELLAMLLLRMDARRAVRTLKANPTRRGEALAAGALGIQLGGDIRVRGVVMHKRKIGEALRDPESEDIAKIMWLSWLTCALNTVLALIAAMI